MPSVKEQNLAVQKFIDMENALEIIKIEIQTKLQNLKALKSSLLDQAFKGEL